MKASSLLLGAGVVVGGYLLYTKLKPSSQPSTASQISTVLSGAGSFFTGLKGLFGSSSSSSSSSSSPIAGTLLDPSTWGSPASTSSDDSTSSGPITDPSQVARVDTGVDLSRSATGAAVAPHWNSIASN